MTQTADHGHPHVEGTEAGRRAISGAKLTLMGQWTKLAAQLLSVVILARLLSPEDFGLFAMVVAITGFALVIGDFGFSSAAIQAKRISHQQKSNLFWLNTLVGIIAAVVLLLLAGPIEDFYDASGVREILGVLSLNFIISAMTTQFAANVTRSMKFKVLFIADVGGAVLGLVLAVALGLMGAGVWALVAQKVTLTVATLVVVAVGGGWRPSMPGRAPMRALISFGWKTFAVQVLTYVSTAIPVVSLGRSSPPAEVGFYERAQQLYQMPTAQLATPLTRVMLPVLSGQQDDKEALTSYLTRAQVIIAYVVGGVMAMTVVFADLVVNVALGDGWEAAAPILAILCLGGFFQSIGYVLQWSFVSTGNVGLQLRVSIMTRLVMVVLVLIASAHGPVSVAMAVAVGLAINWTALFLYALPRTGIALRPLAGAVFRALSVHAVAGAGAWVMIRLLPSHFGMYGVWLTALVVAALLYAGQAFLLPYVRRDFALCLAMVRSRRA